MKIIANTINNKLLQMELPFASFLNGTLASHLSGDDLNPKDLLYEQLPATSRLESMTEEELVYTLEDACLRASKYECAEESVDFLTPVKIKIDADDVANFKQLFFPLHGMSLVRTSQNPRNA